MNERLEPALKWCKDNKKRINEKPYEWYANNRERLNKYHREYRSKSIKNILTDRIRGLVNYSLKRRGIEVKSKCWRLLGFSVKQLKEKLNKTIPKGYTWQDFIDGELDIDHIRPVRSFNYKCYTDKGFKDCWSLNNLRLLTVYDNRSSK